jgi:hypothetical protein
MGATAKQRGSGELVGRVYEGIYVDPGLLGRMHGVYEMTGTNKQVQVVARLNHCAARLL